MQTPLPQQVLKKWNAPLLPPIFFSSSRKQQNTGSAKWMEILDAHANKAFKIRKTHPCTVMVSNVHDSSGALRKE
jgi:hypothetical protein